MDTPHTSVALDGREAAHLLRIIAIARQRGQPLLPAVTATAIPGSFSAGKRLNRLLDGVREEDLLERLRGALSRGRDPSAGAMLAALERTGLPAEGIRELASWLSARASQRHDLYRAVAYPFTLMITGSLIYTVAFHCFAMPVLMDAFNDLYRGLGASLPVLTSAFIAVYKVGGSMLASPLTAMLYLIGVAILCLACLRFGLRFTHYRISLALPFAGQYLRFEAARSFSQTLALLLSFDVPLPEAVRLAADAVASPVIRDRLGKLSDQVADGEALGECLRSQKSLPPSVAWRLWSAYYRSTFEDDLREIASSCNRELAVWELRVFAAVKFVAVGLAAVVLSPVALAVIAMYMPMFSLISMI